MRQVFLFSLLLSLSACNPFYVARAAYEQSKILLKRQDIKTLLGTDQLKEDERNKLGLVLEARSFAEKIGLNPGGSFKKYSRLDRKDLAWVLLASKPDAFRLFTWWFPVVGSVPYKGYFDKSAADKAAKVLESMNYETYVRTTSAISTLGWFDDPLLSTTLQNPEHTLVNTVIHESLHSTVWIPGQVDFNESLANFVGLQGAYEFFNAKATACQEQEICLKLTQYLNAAGASRESELKFSKVIEALFNDLDALYSSSATREEKLARRVEIFDRHIGPIRARNPNMKIFESINNAEIIQIKLYMTGLEMFKRLFECKRNSWPEFLAGIKSIAQQVEADGSKNAWDLLKTNSAC